ncbi:MAG: PIN domain-containing protein [Acidimicrobiales bacterium]
MLVVLDACVLYPPSLRDLLLTLAALDAFDVRWSETILEELRRNVVADSPQLDAARFSSHTLAEMRRHFPEAVVSVGQADIDGLDNHPKDRHVAAVAVKAGADAIVTINMRDFRSRILEAGGVSVVTPGQLVEAVLDEAPELVSYALRRMSSRWTNPPHSISEIVELLARHPTMARPMSRVRGTSG